MLVLQNNEEVRYELKGIEIEYINTGSKISKSDLSFNIYEYDELAVELEYCTALYRQESARRILDHYIKILEQITERAESKIEELELTT
ncbi:hypothetical protein HGI79_03165 [Clostridium sp. DJ247]|nr:hypothetical protein [Clostridium sp. DJ247]MBC2579315.1 hypothetical protein [Clostridium sp. DJ247]